jgi:hypothetical protein
MDFDDPVATALRVALLLEKAEIPYGLYGGLAVAAFGVPRETRDADIAVISAAVTRLVEMLSGDGVLATAAFDRVPFGGLVVSRAALLPGGDDTGLNTVDLVEPASSRYAALAIGRVLRAPLRDRKIAILTPEDVVIFKMLSTRERDLEDAAAILRELGDDVDVASIDSEIALLTAELPAHDTGERWARCRGSARAGSP